MSPPAARLWSTPNLLSLSRVPLAVVLFACVSYRQWAAGLVVFLLAAVTDWLDGWWARRSGQVSLVGRNLDPLTDKILVCGAFVYLLPVGPDAPDTGIRPWMVTVVVAREVLITGVRGIVEAAGKAFAADWFGKLKMGLQCAVIIGVLLVQSLKGSDAAAAWVPWLEVGLTLLLYGTLAATVGSGLQYLAKAAKLIGDTVSGPGERRA